MSVLYPLKFKPAYFEKIWGGQHVKTILHQNFGDLMNCGEAWLLSGLEGQNSIVCNGDFAGDELNDLIETFMGDLVGEDVFNKYGERFPSPSILLCNQKHLFHRACQNLLPRLHNEEIRNQHSLFQGFLIPKGRSF